jgi:hypothetical protein
MEEVQPKDLAPTDVPTTPTPDAAPASPAPAEPPATKHSPPLIDATSVVAFQVYVRNAATNQDLAECSIRRGRHWERVLAGFVRDVVKAHGPVVAFMICPAVDKKTADMLQQAQVKETSNG